MPSFACTDCHDPHGSSNYRLLKDDVGGDKTNYVISNEENFPTGGFSRGPAGALEIAAYVPNYTSPYYAKSADDKGMAQWCAGCHTVYGALDGGLTGPRSTYDYSAETSPGTFPPGAQVFHRHPIGVTVAQGQEPLGSRALTVATVDDPGLPLEMPTPPADFHATKPWDETGNVSCLTCHQAHGNASSMSGWALSVIGADGYPTRSPAPVPRRTSVTARRPRSRERTSTAESILRFPNRGVCERCHNK